MHQTVTLRQLNKKVTKLEKKMREVCDVLNLLPPVVDPTEWKRLHERDKAVLRFMISESDGNRDRWFTTSEIAEGIGLDKPSSSGRVQVWRSLRRIKRLQRRHHKRVILEDKGHKRWSLNSFDFRFRFNPPLEA